MNATRPLPPLGLALTGVSGAGKSTLAEALCSREQRFSWLSAVTTRSPRPDDRPGAYIYISDHLFQELKENGLLLNHTIYRDRHYGISLDTVRAAVDSDLVPLILVSPESVSRFQSYRDWYSVDRTLPTDPTRVRFCRVFLDAPDDILNARLSVRDGVVPDAHVLAQRAEDRRFKTSCDHMVANIDLKEALTSLTQAYAAALATFRDA